jgi:broad specificity phosphatase PhoE
MTREELWFSRGRVTWDAEQRDYRSAPNGTVILYALRHGTTQLNEDNKFRGWIDVSLDDKGEKDAAKAAKFLSGRGIKAIYCSNLKRTEETAAIVGDVLGLSPQSDARLRPWDVGELSGKDKTENDEELQYYSDHPKETIPDGESLQHFGDRSQNALDEYIEIARARGPILLVFHTSNTVQLGNYCKGTGAIGRPESDEVVKPGGVLAVTDLGNKLECEAILKDGGKGTYGS